MRLVLIGGSGLLGAALTLEAIARGAEVTIISRRPMPTASWDVLSLDVTAPDAIEAIRPLISKTDAVVNLAAVTSVDACEASDSAEALNVGWPARLAEACAREGTKLAQISTDSVHSIELGAASEADQTAPVNAYAKQKLQAEKRVLETHRGSLVVRTNFFGWSQNKGTGLAGWILASLRRGREVTGFADVFFNPLYSCHASMLLLDLLARGANGVVNLAASECLSKLEFALLIAEVFGLDRTLIKAGRLEDSEFRAPRPRRTCLATGRLERLLDRKPPTVREGIIQMAADEDAVRPRIETMFRREVA